jgi:cellulose synthase/poly-beta-1,6-N-acetylglucosamine synthase-like glycosyltransferase
MNIPGIFLYITLFVSLFFEVVLLITYFEIREEIQFEKEHDGTRITSFPSVTIVIPCFNEEKTVAATLRSLLALDYPKERLSLIVIDDGSTDGTQKALDIFRSNPQIKILRKENGGKHTALNFALLNVTTDLVGCLDADSFVAPDALRRIVPYFEDATVMAVTPSIKIHEPKTVLQYVQKVEYGWGVLLRRILASMNALYVTPGPFSIFRVSVFKELGGYRHAHHTEDMEMAMRMQKNHYKIVNAHSAHVYTVGPDKLKGLYKQRVRWVYGFLNNAIDYRDMFFNKEYGNIGVFVLPIATFSVFSTLFAAGTFIWSLLSKIPEVMARYEAVGLTFTRPHISFAFDWFTFNTSLTTWVTLITLILTLTLLGISLKLANGKLRPGKDVVYYLAIYIFIVPLWLAKATYATLARKPISWR